MKYAWIQQHSVNYSVTTLCEFMTVSRSCYYAWFDAPTTALEKENDQLIETLTVLFKQGRGTYGTRRLKNKSGYALYSPRYLMLWFLVVWRVAYILHVVIRGVKCIPRKTNSLNKAL